jgi:hypothetical protein
MCERKVIAICKYCKQPIYEGEIYEKTWLVESYAHKTCAVAHRAKNFARYAALRG